MTPDKQIPELCRKQSSGIRKATHGEVSSQYASYWETLEGPLTEMERDR